MGKGKFWRAVLGGNRGTVPWKGTCERAWHQRVLEQGSCWIWGWDLLGRWLKDWGKILEVALPFGCVCAGVGHLCAASRTKCIHAALPRGCAQGGPRCLLVVPEAPLCPGLLAGWEQVLTVQAGLADGLVDPAGLHHPLAQVAGFAALPARRVHLGEALVLGAPGGSLGEKNRAGR